MDQSKLRKNYSDYGHSAYGDNSPSAQKSCNKKSRHKSSAHQSNYTRLYDPGFSSYAFNLPPQTRIHPASQRLFSPPDPSVCHYSVPLGFSLEHVSLPVYSTLLQPGSTSTTPFERVVRIARSNDQTKIPAIFEPYKQNSKFEQDYMSLPPVNCDLNSKKSKDEEINYRRRFSDPGVAQISSDECSGSRSSESSSCSSKDLPMPYAYGLIEQVNELKENNSHLTKELHEIKLELESFKMLTSSWRCFFENLQPGNLTDNIAEVREALKVNEEALLAKMEHLDEKNSARCNEIHRKLGDKLSQEMSERLSKLEEQVHILMDKMSEMTAGEGKKATEEVAVSCVNDDVLSIQQELVDSEREKLLLRKELQEALDGRKKAEANTLKLERLVNLLRKKINGVSLETCISDEKQNVVRPLVSSFEQNPFIVANNKHSQKGFYQRKKSDPKVENNEIVHNINEIRESDPHEMGNGSGSSRDSPTANSSDGTALAPQVTITGPVTDL